MAFKAKEYARAVEAYNEVIGDGSGGGDDDCAMLALSNRVQAHLALNAVDAALTDARQLVSKRPHWPKSHFRLATALSSAQYPSSESLREACLALHECERLLASPPSADVQALRTRLDAQCAASTGHVAQCPAVAAGLVSLRLCTDFAHRGRGVFASKPITAAGEPVFVEEPLVSHIEASAPEEYLSRCCAHCMRSKLTSAVVHKLLAMPSATSAWPAPLVAWLQNVEADVASQQMVSCPCCNACYCSDECRDAAYASHHALLCPGSAASIMAEYERRCKELRLTHPLCIARIAAMVATAVVVRHEALDVALRPFTSFCWSAWASPADEELSAMLHEALQRGGVPPGVADAVASLAAFRMFCGVLQRNAGRVHPLSDLHTFLCNAGRDGTITAEIVRELHTSQWAAALTCGGTALFPVANSINHSCSPNVQFCSASNDHRILVISTQPLPQNTELLVSYIDDAQPRANRQQELLSKYLFSCLCDRCKHEASLETSTTTATDTH